MRARGVSVAVAVERAGEIDVGGVRRRCRASRSPNIRMNSARSSAGESQPRPRASVDHAHAHRRFVGIARELEVALARSASRAIASSAAAIAGRGRRVGFAERRRCASRSGRGTCALRPSSRPQELVHEAELLRRSTGDRRRTGRRRARKPARGSASRHARGDRHRRARTSPSSFGAGPAAADLAGRARLRSSGRASGPA